MGSTSKDALHPALFQAIPSERLALSIKEVARVTGLSTDNLYAQVRRGALAHRRAGRRIVVTREALQAWLLGKGS